MTDLASFPKRTRENKQQGAAAAKKTQPKALHTVTRSFRFFARALAFAF